ncbi:MAG: MATE family efflux transporter [Planctomycetaceae bacterium]|jgi:putative MATE family efflux protein|nr:MATE family efflux transporter [Planctomycetaceae bacterium]
MKTRHLGERSILLLLAEFSIPSIAATLVTASHGIINRIFVGWTLGADGITAVTITIPIFTLMLAFGMTVGIGSNTLLSIRLGERRYDESERIIGQSIALFAILGVCFMVFGFLAREPLLRFFGADDAVMPYAKEYLSVMVCGAFFHEMSFGVNGFLRGEGKPRLAMATILIAALLNIFFDWLFLIQFRTEIWGAAYATVLAQFFSTCWVAFHYLSGKTVLKWRWEYIRIDWGLSREVFMLGLPPFIMQAVACVLQALQMNQLMFYGNRFGELHGIKEGGHIAVSAFGIVFIVSMCVYLTIIGLNQGVQPIVGYNIGAGKFNRVARTLKVAIICVTIFTFVCAVLFFIFPHFILSSFADQSVPANAEMLKLSIYAVKVLVSMLPLAGVVIVMTGYFQSNGQPQIAIMLTLIRQAVLFIPLIIILPYFFEWIGCDGLDGIWYAMPICDIGSFIFTAYLIKREFKRLKLLEKNSKERLNTSEIPNFIQP